jgi:hypothetical protein
MALVEGLVPDPITTFPFATLHEVNHRLIELLVHAARAPPPPPFSLITPLRDLLRMADLPTRKAAAARTILLLDMQFEQPGWWAMSVRDPERSSRGTPEAGAFSRRTGVPLARATLTLAWRCVQADPVMARVVLGMHPEVAQVIGSMRLVDIDRFATRHFRRLRPRWADRPHLWRALLLASQANATIAARDFDLRAFQLLLGSHGKSATLARKRRAPRLESGA